MTIQLCSYITNYNYMQHFSTCVVGRGGGRGSQALELRIGPEVICTNLLDVVVVEVPEYKRAQIDRRVG